MKKSTRCSTLLVLVLLGVAMRGEAATRTWNNSGGNGLWSNSNN